MHLGADNVLVGDSIASATVIGDVSGLQSQPAAVAITFPPDSAFASPTDTVRIVIASDTLRSSDLTVTLTGRNRVGAAAGDASGGAQGFVVRYAIVYAPASIDADSSTVFLTDGSRASAADTTDASGVAARKVAIVLHLVANEGLLSGASTDSVVVDATVNGRGSTVLPSALLRFVIHLSK
jgi:alpha/beta superfamily hydrolase